LTSLGEPFLFLGEKLGQSIPNLPFAVAIGFEETVAAAQDCDECCNGREKFGAVYLSDNSTVPKKSA
jgi:hypothetical protein